MEIETVRLKFEVSKETKTLIGFVTRSSATWRLRGVSEKKTNVPRRYAS